MREKNSGFSKEDEVVFNKKNNNTAHCTTYGLAYFVAPGNGRTLKRDASVRTAFQVIEEANTDVGNLRSKYFFRH